jgi:hypothetical protein
MVSARCELIWSRATYWMVDRFTHGCRIPGMAWNLKGTDVTDA